MGELIRITNQTAVYSPCLWQPQLAQHEKQQRERPETWHRTVSLSTSNMRPFRSVTIRLLIQNFSHEEGSCLENACLPYTSGCCFLLSLSLSVCLCLSVCLSVSHSLSVCLCLCLSLSPLSLTLSLNMLLKNGAVFRPNRLSILAIVPPKIDLLFIGKHQEIL